MNVAFFDPVDATVPVVTPIPDGCADIAKLLGHEPADTIWDFGRVFSPQSGVRDPDPTAGVFHQAVTSLIYGATTGISLGLHKGFLDYQREYLGVSNIIEITKWQPPSNEYHYPMHSIPAQMVRRAQEEAPFGDFFRGKIYCAWLPNVDVQRTANELGARTLISAENMLRFNSKVDFVSNAYAGQYNVAPHAVATHWELLEERMGDVATMAQNLGIDSDDTRYWIKFDHMSSGRGVLSHNPRKSSFHSVQTWIGNTLEHWGRTRRDFMPVVIDIDIGALPDVKRIRANLNVQGVIGMSGPFLTGVTLQNVSSMGKYQGGALPLSDEEKLCALEAQKWAWPVFRRAHDAGYRGYVGVDLILCEGRDGRMRGYNLEMNARLNGSTFLLAVAQRVGRDAGLCEHALGFDLITSTFGPFSDFEAFHKTFHDVLYRGARSEYTGIVPLIMMTNTFGAICRAKLIFVAPDPKRLQNLKQRYQALMETISC